MMITPARASLVGAFVAALALASTATADIAPPPYSDACDDVGRPCQNACAGGLGQRTFLAQACTGAGACKKNPSWCPDNPDASMWARKACAHEPVGRCIGTAPAPKPAQDAAGVQVASPNVVPSASAAPSPPASSASGASSVPAPAVSAASSAVKTSSSAPAPSSSVAAAPPSPPPRKGCAVSAPGASAGSGAGLAWALGVLGVLAMAARRRRRG